jgi:terminal uridylyltransferase
MPAYVQVPPSPQSSFASSPVSQHRPRLPSKHRFTTDLSQCLINFIFQLLPTPQEKVVKEDVRKLLERLIRTIEPESRLLSFGSTANGFSLRNSGQLHLCPKSLDLRSDYASDMDLCCLIDSDKRRSACDLVTVLGSLLERGMTPQHLVHPRQLTLLPETKFHVKPLPHARIPIVKLSLDSSPGLPLGIACDIGFENRLALENTRLLMCYGMIDPTRVRTLVLFRE